MAENTIGIQIYKLRKSKGLSQEELGFEIGVSRQTVSKWEADVMRPNIENIRTLCSVFNVDINYFVNGSISDLPVSELAVNRSADSEKKHLSTNKLTGLVIILSIVIIVIALFGTICGLIIFSPNNGDSAVSMIKFDISLFIVTMALLGILLVLDVFLIIKLIHKKKI